MKIDDVSEASKTGKGHRKVVSHCLPIVAGGQPVVRSY